MSIADLIYEGELKYDTEMVKHIKKYLLAHLKSRFSHLTASQPAFDGIDGKAWESDGKASDDQISDWVNERAVNALNKTPIAKVFAAALERPFDYRDSGKSSDILPGVDLVWSLQVQKNGLAIITLLMRAKDATVAILKNQIMMLQEVQTFFAENILPFQDGKLVQVIVRCFSVAWHEL